MSYFSAFRLCRSPKIFIVPQSVEGVGVGRSGLFLLRTDQVSLPSTLCRQDDANETKQHCCRPSAYFQDDVCQYRH